MGVLVRDDQAAPCLDGRTCKVVVGLEGLHRDVEPLGDFLKGVADTDTVPMAGVRLRFDVSDLDGDRKGRKLVGRGSIQ